MSPKFPISKITLAILTLSAASLSQGAGLDRSGQDITAFLQDGTYAEVVYTYIDADVTGYDNTELRLDDANGNSILNNYTKGNEISDIAESYEYARYGVKVDVNDMITLGVLYDEPWGAAAEYKGSNNFVSNIDDINSMISNLTNGQITSLAQSQGAVSQLIAGATQAGAGAMQAKTGAEAKAAAAAKAVAAGDAALARQLGQEAQALATQATALKQKADSLIAQATPLVSVNAIAGGINDADGEGTSVNVHSRNITGLVGVKLGKNLQVYGGPALQRLEGDLSLRGAAYLTSTGYNAHIASDDGYGWVAGVMFEKPEIALKAALTYRSEIDHTSNVGEYLPTLNYLPQSTQALIGQMEDANGKGKMDITTPESFNFDFQTGLNQTTLATAKVRYVPWSDFELKAPLHNAASKTKYPDGGLPLVDYTDDQWLVEVGLAKRLTPSFAVSGAIGWDSGAGNPATSLGPIEGYYSVGAGAKLNVNENWAISAGGKYLMFGDAKGALSNGKVASNFEDNDGYALGVKLSYQAK